ncbi:MAG: hypothetical protein HXY49_01685 [Ignavibacteriaceae bacterium]|nr:hypothetical protein [Ignavibacteriaceae bacterium]
MAIRKYYLLAFTSLALTACERDSFISGSDDGIAPAVPTNFVVFLAEDGDIILNWDANVEKDLKGYNVWRKTDSTDYSFLDFTQDDYYIDDSLNYSTKYFYKISSVDFFGLESSYTDEVSAVPENKNPPRTPLNLKINARNWEGHKSIFLSWKSNPESDLAGYRIYRSENANFIVDSSTYLRFVPNNSFEDTNSTLSFYKNYFYKITAVDKGDLSSSPAQEVTDMIYEEALQIFPENNSEVLPFSDLKIRSIGVPARYLIVVQENEFFGEIWRNEFSYIGLYDTLSIRFNPQYIEPYRNYYWRIITYYPNSSEPNSISRLYKFKIKY